VEIAAALMTSRIHLGHHKEILVKPTGNAQALLVNRTNVESGREEEEKKKNKGHPPQTSSKVRASKHRLRLVVTWLRGRPFPSTSEDSKDSQ
jgi:hypothetical protein